MGTIDIYPRGQKINIITNDNDSDNIPGIIVNATLCKTNILYDAAYWDMKTKNRYVVTLIPEEFELRGEKKEPVKIGFSQ
jgi:hypothetical protein